MKAVILAGGKGTRLAPYTTILPKPLLPVGEMPILEIIIRQLRSYGIKDIILCVGHLGSLLEAYFGSGKKWDVTITYSYESKPLGTATPMALIKGLDSTFLLMNGDIMTTLDYGKMIKFHQRHGQLVTVGVGQKKVKINLGVLKSGIDGVIEDYIEKPELSYAISMGIYVFEPKVIELIDPDQKLDLPDLVLKLIKAKKKVMGFKTQCQWLDLGYPEDFARAVEMFVTNPGDFIKKRRS